MKKYSIAIILVLFFVLYSACAASAQQPEVAPIQAAIDQAGAHWTAGDTSVGALTDAERAARIGFLQAPIPKVQRTPAPVLLPRTMPSSLDWRNNGGNFVTGIRDQGGCGSCWAFGSVAGLESRTLIANHTPGVDLDLSEQVVVSCSGLGNCGGGYLVDNFFVNTGVPLESCYPYTATNGLCANVCANWQSNTYKVSRYTWIVPYGSQQTVEAIKSALVAYGPTEVTFATYNDFYWYVSGVYSHVTGSLVGYHAVLVVGYDDANGCFIAKNSWGKGWGEGGFFRIAYSEVTGDCDFGYQTLSYGDTLISLISAITYPAGGSELKAGTPTAIQGTAEDLSGAGLEKVEVSTDGGVTWGVATDSSSDGSWSTWSYPWPVTTPGSYTLKSRATDRAGTAEDPGAGLTVSVIRVGFFDNMESGASDWTPSSGFWHMVTDGASPYPNSYSQTHSWWFGQDSTGNYDNGLIAAGDIVTKPFYIPAGATLSFRSWEETEDTPGYDLRTASVSTDDGITWTQVFNSDDNSAKWRLATADLSAFGDRTGRVKFTLDTVDRMYNSYRGWYIDDVLVSSPPSSAIQSPASGATVTGPVCVVTGTATDYSSTGLKSVEVSTDGGRTWKKTTGTTFWSYSWAPPASGGNRTLLNRATDNAGNVETPGAGVPVTVAAYGNPELPHYKWNAAMTANGTDCAFCHAVPGQFLGADFRKKKEFCYSCHNAAGNAHALSLYSSRGQHTLFVNATAAGRKKPTYGNITAGERNNIPASRLENGYLVTCYACHNSMRKSDDPGRNWEYTSTSDGYTYRLQNGGWLELGNLAPKVYRDTALWSGPTYSQTRKNYLVNPSEYTYNEMSGFIRFKSQQPSGSYVYATLYYPYLRAPMQDNALCADCHTEATHKGINCMNCHQAHNTGNIEGIREKVRTTNFSTVNVKFTSLTGANSFADGDATHDGICEVCHTTTKYYRSDGSGFANHSGGYNYDGKDCTACHSHRTGFGKTMVFQGGTPTVPSAPVIGAAVAGNTSATVSFAPPLSTGDSPITGYTVTSLPPGGVDANAGSTQLTHTITGLTNGTTYTFTVTATNAVGTSPASAVSNGVTPMTVPGAPTGVTATAGNASATVSFTVPPSGGSPITLYTVTSSGGQKATGAASPITVTGLTNGTTYTFTVTAANAVGTSPASAVSNGVTPENVLMPPANFTATITVGATTDKVTLTWTLAPGATGYHIQKSSVSSSFPTPANYTLGSTATSYSQNLAKGKTYYWRIQSTNAAGASAWSPTLTTVLP